MRKLAILGAIIFAFVLFMAIPAVITMTGRKDLYFTFTSVALLSIASAGVWLTFYMGRINIGQGAYALIGGYVAGILMTQYQLSFWLSLPLAGLFCVFISILIGLPILRLRGVYFAMVTLVSTEVARLTAMALPITQGAKGLTNIPLPDELSLFGMTLIPSFSSLSNSNQGFYFLSVTLMLIAFALMYRLVTSRFGQLCLSLQQNEELASSIGVNITSLRIIAYAISSFLGGIGGAIFASLSQSIYPSSFTVQDSVNFMLNCFLGGLNYVFGPILGTFTLYFGWDLLFQTGKYQLLIYSIIIILLMLFLPNGLLSIRLWKAKARGAV
ncbi:MAG: branched-chain amino acid ABC transporter permease [Thiofilum sp.]|uniref:branched-chain amino acid ABC transporter permease n=1 Tax=Thiofilum sp. TaxID=2212733 RepID=UPI0025EE669C|nr:branched-chain amino acid ABC transporter permease [Thiofilum sp.]MBK8454040.1 branched-chain amino acid ABC transporter permease [Thiofilum sp.]